MGAGLQAAASERSLLAPVATRKARAELSRKEAGSGLIVLEAVYGVLPAYRDAIALEQQGQPLGSPSSSAAVAVGTAAIAAAAAAEPSVPAAAAAAGAGGGSPSSEGREGEAAAAEAGSAAAAVLAPLHPPWIRVTEALQYLVVDSRLVLHPGVAKVGGWELARMLLFPLT